MSTISTDTSFGTAFAPPPLPFYNGQRMTASELLRRWEELPELVRLRHKRTKIELLGGFIRMSPTSGGFHASPEYDFHGALAIYSWSTPGVVAGAPASIILDEDNIPEPDAFMAIDPKHGGRIRFDEKGYIYGAPEFHGEISASSVARDLGHKKEIYRRFGVNEYVVWRVKEKIIDWFVLRGEQYEPLPAPDGISRSETFPGLWLAAPALVAGDYARVTQVLQEGLATPEHHMFVEKLAKQRL